MNDFFPWGKIEHGVPPAREAWAGWAVIVLLIFAVLLTVHFTARAYAQGSPRVLFDCQQFAHFARGVVVFRDVGANRDKVIAELRREVRPGMMLAALEREVKLVYAGKMARVEAEHSAFKRCQQQLGDMGQEG